MTSEASARHLDTIGSHRCMAAADGGLLLLVELALLPQFVDVPGLDATALVPASIIPEGWTVVGWRCASPPDAE